MANWTDPNAGLQGQRPGSLNPGARTVERDAGLRSYMLKVYNYMASGVLVTGIVAMLFSRGGIESPAATGPKAGPSSAPPKTRSPRDSSRHSSRTRGVWMGVRRSGIHMATRFPSRFMNSASACCPAAANLPAHRSSYSVPFRS